MGEQIKFAPRKALLAHFEEGWRLIPGHPYQPSDWAILVYMPTYPKPVPMELMKRWAKRFEEQPVPVRRVTRNTRNGRKLSEEKAAEIRARIAAGEAQWRIAQRYGVARCTVNNISVGRTWA
jgi:DNA-binding XRE family transcriptional regulator